MKDYQLKLRNLHASHTLGWSWNWNTKPAAHASTKKKVVYYESIKRKLKIKQIYECRCDGRLQTKRFTRLSYTGLVVQLEHLKIKTRLTNEKPPGLQV